MEDKEREHAQAPGAGAPGIWPRTQAPGSGAASQGAEA